MEIKENPSIGIPFEEVKKKIIFLYTKSELFPKEKTINLLSMLLKGILPNLKRQILLLFKLKQR